MILQYYGRRVMVSETAERCEIGRDGASALMVARAAQGYGLKVVPMVVHDLDELPKLNLPAILHWAFNHFVVLERVGPREAVIVDPARGRTKVSRKELDRKFTGVALTMAPGPEFDLCWTPEPSPGWDLAKKILRTPGIRRLFAKIFVASLLLTVLGLMGPLATAIVFDRILPSGQTSALPLAAVTLGLLLVCEGLLEYGRGTLVVEMQNRVGEQLMSGFFAHLLRLPLVFFQNRSSGDLLQRMATNDALRAALTQSTVGSMLDGILVVAYAIILFTFSPTFGLAAAALGLIHVVLAMAPAKRVIALVLAELTETGRQDGFAVETLKGIDSLKASGDEEWAFNRWLLLFQRQQVASVQRARFTTGISALTTTVSQGSPVVLLLLGTYQVFTGQLTVGMMLALLALANQMLQPIARLASMYQELQTLRGHLHRLGKVLAAAPEQAAAERSAAQGQGPGATSVRGASGLGHHLGITASERQITHQGARAAAAGAKARRWTATLAPAHQRRRALREAPRLRGDIELQDVGLRHTGASSWAVRHITTSIPAGSHIALVGASGSGKSTLLKVILGLYEPNEGRVLLDGHDLRGLDYSSVRQQCGVVTQEAVVFHGTIRQNITMGNKTSMSAVRRAAQLADLERDIAEMPMAYETIISESGGTLSGGQRQRLALARALVRSPAILLLDEATSALDPITQATISRNLAQIDATIVTVAHRLSIVQGADTVLVLHEGRFIEEGNHNALIARRGLYAEMVNSDGNVGALP
jgi:ABC-type bacteriocin/lantibiotic exporter with double-glycine peptidase domain